MAGSDFWEGYWIYGVALAIGAAVWLVREARSRAAQSWPIADGTVEFTMVREEGFGEGHRYIPEVHYSYKVEGEFYSGAHVVDGDADFDAFPKGSRVIVHYKRSNPAVSFLDREDLRSKRERLMAEVGEWPG